MGTDLKPGDPAPVERTLLVPTGTHQGCPFCLRTTFHGHYAVLDRGREAEIVMCEACRRVRRISIL